MAEISPEVFQRPTYLDGEPRLLNPRPSSEATITHFNNVYGRIQTAAALLEQKLAQGEELSVNEMRTLIDARIVRAGRRNLNAADRVAKMEDQIRAGQAVNPSILNPELASLQAGRFTEIYGTDRPVELNAVTDTFVVPVVDNGHPYAIKDRIPVEGLLTFIDNEIMRTSSDGELRRLERDVLFTQSQPIFKNQEEEIIHARNQIESYLKSIDPLISEWHLPDWYKGDDILNERRGLMFQQPRGSQRIHNRALVGCLPLLLAVPLLLWPHININRISQAQPNPNLCTDKVSHTPPPAERFKLAVNPNPDIDGSNVRAIIYAAMQRPNDQYLDAANYDYNVMYDKMRAGQVNGTSEKIIQTALEIKAADQIENGQRIRGDKANTPFHLSTDFGQPELLVTSCYTSEDAIQLAEDYLADQQNPKPQPEPRQVQWYDGIVGLYNRVTSRIPRLDIEVNIR